MKRLLRRIKLSFKKFVSLIKFKRASKASKVLIVFTSLLYLTGIVSFIIASFTSDEWVNGLISARFVLTGIVLPIFLISIAFLIQMIALILDFYDRVAIYIEESKFLTALENTAVKTGMHRLFLCHLIEQWRNNTRQLTKGLLSIHHDYWTACSTFFEYGRYIAECTSVIPLSWWDEDSEDCDAKLLEYKEIQKSVLIRHNVTVRRTFVLTEMPNNDLFFKIVIQQLVEGFQLFYIKLYNLKGLESDLLDKLKTDFLLLDDIILMVGKLPEKTRSLYYYDFHILKEAINSYELHKGDIEKVFSKPEGVITGQFSVHELSSYLHIRQHRKPIKEFDAFSVAKYKAPIDSILKSRGDYKDYPLSPAT